RVRASYNPATKDVGFRVDFTEWLPTVTAPLGFGFSLGALGGLNTSSTVSLDAAVSLGFSFGVRLTPLGQGQTLADKFYVEDAAAGGSVFLSAADVNVSARFGFLEIRSTGGSGYLEGSLSTRLKDPATGTPGGRVYLP